MVLLNIPSLPEVRNFDAPIDSCSRTKSVRTHDLASLTDSTFIECFNLKVVGQVSIESSQDILVLAVDHHGTIEFIGKNTQRTT